MESTFSKPAPILELSRGLTVRTLLHSDADLLAKRANNPKIIGNMTNFWPDPYTSDAAHKFIATVRDKKDWRKNHAIKLEGEASSSEGVLAPCHWAIALKGEVIGVIGSNFQGNVYEHTAEMGYWIAEDFW
jgi:[ribosomal protein S5]-alanine N-acetyltransferase